MYARTFKALVSALAATALPTQIEAAQITFRANLNAAQAGTAGSGGTGTGSGTVILDTAANELTFNITFSGLSAPESVSHIHGPAAPGVNAGVVYGLPLGSPKTGTIVMTDPVVSGPYPIADQIADLENGLWYINIHSTAFPAGEIRGQLFLQQAPLPFPVVFTGTLFVAAGVLVLGRKLRQRA